MRDTLVKFYDIIGTWAYQVTVYYHNHLSKLLLFDNVTMPCDYKYNNLIIIIIVIIEKILLFLSADFLDQNIVDIVPHLCVLSFHITFLYV